MLLAIDIGNTHVVLGLYRGEELRANWRIQSNALSTVDEYAIAIISLLDSIEVERNTVDSVILSCVVPPLTRVFTKLSTKYFSVEPMVVGPGLKTGMSICVDDPRSVGSDRIVNAVAARELFGAPIIVVDFGTATTFDVVSSEGNYEGGVIAPGVLIAAEALWKRAAKLPAIELRRPERTIGKNTRDSMLAGIYFGYVELVDGIVGRLRQELASEVKTIATGGLARALSEDSKYIEEVVPELTLMGLRTIASFNS